MNRTIAMLATAATVAFAPAAYADAHVSMGAGFDMLMTSLAADFERLGIEMESMDDVTVGELAAIKAIIESTESENQQKGRIEAILAD